MKKNRAFGLFVLVLFGVNFLTYSQVTVTKILSDASGNALPLNTIVYTGDYVYFKISSCNTSSTAASNVKVIDYSDKFSSNYNGTEIENIQYISHTPASITAAPTTPTVAGKPGQMVYTLPNIAANSCVDIIAKYKIIQTCACGVTNTGVLTATVNGSTASDQSSVTLSDYLYRKTDIGVTKVVDNSTPTVGQNVTFTIEIKNLGQGEIASFDMTDVLPTGLQFVSGNVNYSTNTPNGSSFSAGAFSAMPTGGKFSFSFDHHFNDLSNFSIGNPLISGDEPPITITIVAKVTATTGTITNTTKLSNFKDTFNDPICNVNSSTTNDEASASVTVTAACTAPTVGAGSPVVTQATCNAAGTAANNDASIAISGITNGTVYAYTTDGSTPAFAGATAISGGAINLTGLSNPAAATTYKFRIFNGSASCYVDVTATLNPKVCSPTCTAPTVGAGSPVVTQATCNAAGTAANNDASISITGITNGTVYAYTTDGSTPAFAGATAVSGGAINLTGLSNPAAATTYKFRIFNGSATCYVDVTATLNPKVCSPTCTTPTNGTPTTSAGTCTGSALNNDATISIGSITGDKASISTAGAASFDGSAYASATAISGGSITFSNLQHNKAYIIRIYNTSNTCYNDVSFTTANRSCCSSPTCGTVTIQKN